MNQVPLISLTSFREGDLGLGPLAAQALLVLTSEFGPDVIRVTRGYSDLRGQARAMAGNVVRNKEWIKQTYTRQDRPSYAVACRLQEAVYLHAEVQDRGDIEQYLYEALLAIPNGHDISFHTMTLHGQPAAEAFDMHPLEDSQGIVTPLGARVVARIIRLPDLDAFLRREGGLRIWHLQFLRKPVTV